MLPAWPPVCTLPSPATELLGVADLAPGAAAGVAVQATGVRSVEGEAIVNNRKNKAS